jgi:hypothetical protein
MLKKALIKFRDLLANFFAISNSYFFTAIVWRISLRRIHNGGEKTSGKKIILLSRPGGNEDVQHALNYAGKPCSYYLFPRALLKQIFNIYLDGLVSDADYRNLTPDIEANKKKYRNHLAKVIGWFNILFGINAFIEFNITYYAEKELAEVAKLHGINFITLHKECLKTEAASGVWADFLENRHYKFNIDSIAVYNEMTKNALLKSGLGKLNNVVVTGCSRVDLAHLVRFQRKELIHKKVVFFMIQNNAGIFFKKDGLKDDFKTLSFKVTKELVEFARQNSDVEFVFKAKVAIFESQTKFLNGDIPENIRLSCDDLIHDLLADASVVVGFNTTANFEAIASGCQVVSPELFSDVPDSLKDYVFSLRGAAYLPTNVEEFHETVNKLIAKNTFDRELTEDKIRVLNDVVGNSDGNAGKRTMKLIEDNI